MEGFVVIVIILGNGLGYQNSNEAVSISYSINTFGKGMNPTILSPVMGK